MKKMTTQRINASYQEIIDLHTESDRVSVLGFHTPCNGEPVRLLRPFWEAYQKVKYIGCSMSLVPAARLPADPSQVSYGAGEPPIDPRDLLNPILFHGCHGNDMGSILNQFYSGEQSNSVDVERMFSDSMDHNMIKTTYEGNKPLYESLYYRALTDNTWLKAHPQRGFRKSMRPMVYRVAVSTSLMPASDGSRMGKVAEMDGDNGLGVDDGNRVTAQHGTLGPNTSTSNNYLLTSTAPGLQQTTFSYASGTGAYTVAWQNPATWSGQNWMTPGIRPLGWIDTRQWTGTNTPQYYGPSTTSPSDQLFAENLAINYELMDANYNYIPKLFMGMCLLPPAYKQEQYFRIVLNHHFAFAKYRGTSMRSNGQLAGVGNVVDMNSVNQSKGDDKDGSDDKGVLDD